MDSSAFFFLDARSTAATGAWPSPTITTSACLGVHDGDHGPSGGPLKTVGLQGERAAGSGVRALWGQQWTRLPGHVCLTIYVTEGICLCQSRGGPIDVIRPGDRVFFEPGEEHWHGAMPNRLMTHLAMLEVGDDGTPATWGEQVTDEEYGAAPPIES